jgi:hypothetical protein
MLDVPSARERTTAGAKKLKMSMSSSYFFCLHFFCNIMSKLTKLENEAKTLKEELEVSSA